MHVIGLSRYPVKSLVGERLDEVEVDQRGVVGDRLWAVRAGDGKLGSGKNSSRFRKMDGLLSLRARYDGVVPVVQLPDGRELRGDDPATHEALTAYVGRAVRLERERDVPHFDEAPLHLLTTASLRRLGEVTGAPVDPRRFRANVLVDTGDDVRFDEADWVGRTVSLGADLQVRVLRPMVRCVMVGMAQVEVPEAPRLLTTIGDANETALGLVAEVVRPGRVRVGDAVERTADPVSAALRAE